jgi:hypothetical protein
VSNLSEQLPLVIPEPDRESISVQGQVLLLVYVPNEERDGVTIAGLVSVVVPLRDTGRRDG